MRFKEQETFFIWKRGAIFLGQIYWEIKFWEEGGAILQGGFIPEVILWGRG